MINIKVRVKVDNTMFNISYDATLVAGQIGFSLHEGIFSYLINPNYFNFVYFLESTPVVEPFAGWAMLTTRDTHITVRNHIQVRDYSITRLR